MKASDSEADQPPPTDFVYLVHDGLEIGKPVVIHAGAARGLRAVQALDPACRAPHKGLPGPQCVVSDSDFYDQVPGYPGRWLAALAPVAGTEFVVVVQTRDDEALQSASVLGLRLLNFGVPMVLASMLLGVALFLLLRRTR